MFTSHYGDTTFVLKLFILIQYFLYFSGHSNMDKCKRLLQQNVNRIFMSTTIFMELNVKCVG